MLKEFCKNCMEPKETCSCHEVALTSIDSIVAEDLVRSYQSKHVQAGKDCVSCNSYDCTSCKRYIGY